MVIVFSRCVRWLTGSAGRIARFICRLFLGLSADVVCTSIRSLVAWMGASKIFLSFDAFVFWKVMQCSGGRSSMYMEQLCQPVIILLCWSWILWQCWKCINDDVSFEYAKCLVNSSTVSLLQENILYDYVIALHSISELTLSYCSTQMCRWNGTTVTVCSNRFLKMGQPNFSNNAWVLLCCSFKSKLADLVERIEMIEKINVHQSKFIHQPHRFAITAFWYGIRQIIVG